MKLFRNMIFGLLAFGFTNCNQGPRPINYGKDHCKLCKMTIADKEFGAEFVTQKGKVYTFDSIECLIDFNKKNQEIGTSYLTPYLEPNTLKLASDLLVVFSEDIKSPMGRSLAAFNSKTEVLDSTDISPERIASWEDAKSEL